MYNHFCYILYLVSFQKNLSITSLKLVIYLNLLGSGSMVMGGKCVDGLWGKHTEADTLLGHPSI